MIIFPFAGFEAADQIFNDISNYINANKEGSKVRYIMTETFNYDRPLAEVMYYLNDCVFDDIFILAPSVKKGKNDSPIRVLANALTKFNMF
jgi:hypothetical protein